MNKKDILKIYSINTKQEETFDKYIELLGDYCKHTNLVGKSTMSNPWKNHILDSLQILPFLENKNYEILDMGTGAGFPGSILSIAGCKNVTLIDSNGKKINFLKIAKKKLNLKTNIVLGRIENLNNLKFDIITSRALANLNKLLSYSQKFIKKNTLLIFLKGKTVNEEIEDAKKFWKFDLKKNQSISDSRGSLIFIENLKKI